MATMPIPDDWNGQDYCCYLVTWPNSEQWVSILAGFVTTPTRGRFWDERTGSVVDAQAIGYEIEAATFGDCNYMTCLEDLAQIIAASGGSGDCSGCGGGSGCGSGGAGYEASAPNPTETDDEGQAPPIGFESWAAYKTYKCNVAQLILNEMQSDLGLYQNLNIAGQFVGGLAIGLAPLIATPAGVVAIGVIAGLLVAIVAFGGTILSDIDDFLSANEQALICAIFAGNDTASSIDAFNAKVSDLADVQEPSNPLNTYIKQLLASMATTDSFNRLVEKNDLINLPTGDCSACDECIVVYSFDADDEGFTFVDQSGPNGSAVGTYNFGTGSLRTTLAVSPATANETAQGEWTKDLSAAGLQASNGDTIVATLGATGGTGGNVSCTVTCEYTDLTTETQNSVGSGARDVTLVLTQEKEIDNIRVKQAKTTGGASTFDVFVDIGRVEVTLANSPCI